ncbi:DUF3037 domain-containing protein [Paraglaciecola agarilytica]|uniref:DUF3037 domain-containing protein n=1 Tax=Paraglaciecola chathamensis TaxID=368405 RepID=UPI001C086F58|nr:DUF3037 domain-containing protein [Paraglaciecola agarilytica]MBU3019035.1 DUF3037 domain-containing protein [Paraglaciecola agarilytica]
MSWFEYSIIRYLPDPKRGEIVNIGILVFRSSGVDVRLLKTSAKLRMFDGASLTKELDELENSIKEISSLEKTTEGRLHLLNTFSREIQLSSLASFSINGTHEYEQIVNRLFDDLVKPKGSREPASTHYSRLHTTLRKDFKKLNLLASDLSEIEKHKIVSAYPLGKSTGLSADFMLKNGKFHMSEVIDFNVIDINSKFKETSLKMMTFLEGKKLLGQNMGCYLVYSASYDKEKDITAHLNMASDYSDSLYNLTSADDKASYFQLLSNLIGKELTLS